MLDNKFISAKTPDKVNCRYGGICLFSHKKKEIVQSFSEFNDFNSPLILVLTKERTETYLHQVILGNIQKIKF